MPEIGLTTKYAVMRGQMWRKAMKGVDRRFGLVLLTASWVGVVEAGPALYIKPLTSLPTKPVTAIGEGFSPDSTAYLFFDDVPLCAGAADSAGSFTCSFTVPSDAVPGVHAVTAKDADQQNARTNLRVRMDWPQYRYSTLQGGYNQYENVLGKSNVGGLVKLWAASNMVNVTSSPVVIEGKVYVGGTDVSTGNEVLAALNAISGAVNWFYELPSRVLASPVVTKDKVFVAAGHNMYAFDRESGEPYWYFGADEQIVSAPVVFGNTLYFGSGDKNVYAIDVNNGSLSGVKWSFTAEGGIYSSPAVAVIEVDGRESAEVLIGSADSKLYALDENGVLKWNYSTEGAIFSSPAVGNGIVYIGSERFVHAVSVDSGELIWKQSVNGRPTSAAIVGETVYVASSDNKLYAFDATSGESFWTVVSNDTPDAETAWMSAPIAANGVVYLASVDGYVRMFDADDGALLGRIKTASYGGPISPLVVNGLLYVASGEGLTAYYNPASPINLYDRPFVEPDPQSLIPDLSLIVQEGVEAPDPGEY